MTEAETEAEKPTALTLDDVKARVARARQQLLQLWATFPAEDGMPPEVAPPLPVAVAVATKAPGEDQADDLEAWLFTWVKLRQEYAIMSRDLRSGQVGKEKRTVEQQQDAMREIMMRAPVSVHLDGGRRVTITSKSLAAYTRMAVLYQQWRMLADACARLGGVLTPRTLPLWIEGREQADAVLGRLLAVVCAREANPPEDAPAPAWWREVTPGDLTRLQAAHIDVGVRRFSELPDPLEPDPETKQRGEKRAARTPDSHKGFGHYIASITRSRKMTEAEVLAADWWQLLASLRAAADAELPDPPEDPRD